MTGRDLGSVAEFFTGPSTARPAAAPAPATSTPSKASTPLRTPSRPRTQAGRTTSTTTAGARVYASLPSEHEAQVRAIAKARGWSLLGVAGAALETYPPALYEAERAAHQPNPVPGSKTKMRHGDTYLAMTVNNAEQREWLDTTLAPYQAPAVAHVLGCALSHYVTTIANEA